MERTTSDLASHTKTEQAIVYSVLCFSVTNLCAIMNPATGECRFTPFVGVMCVTLFEKLSLLIAAATLVGTACLIVEIRRF